jgi:hypothetical protein
VPAEGEARRVGPVGAGALRSPRGSDDASQD